MEEDTKESPQHIFGGFSGLFDSSSLEFETYQTRTGDQIHEGLSNLGSLFYPETKIESDLELLQCKPASDSIKMFVGQIPQDVDESDLLPMFEQFGRVYELRLLRDKLTRKSKGCCFVTFFTRKSALDAQNALHNIKVLPGMHHPIQMKPADCENRTDRKLFIGMIPKSFSESDVRNLFSSYGTIEECTVLRDSNKQSKSCAFVTYLTRQSAHRAVKSMHHSQVFQGCSSPLVVKFADTQRDKHLRRLQLVNDESDDGGNLTPNYHKLSAEPLPSLAIPYNLLQHLQNCGYAQSNSQIPLLNNLNISNIYQAPIWNPATSTVSSNLENIVSNSLLNQLGTQNVGNLTVNDLMILNNILLQFGNANIGLASLPQGCPYSFNSPHTETNKMMTNPKQIEGPDGANLFIYHLPMELTDQKLAELFRHFGKVISAKVFIDKKTKLSKCFGFVSYDNVLSARLAIENLNGYSINGKKLKVEVKKKKRGMN